MVALIALTVVIALWSSRDDARQIERGEEVHHATQWVARALVVGALTLWLADWWDAIGMAALFNITFRFDLNMRRGLPWDYVSYSNYYDSFFIRLYGDGAGEMAYALELIALAITLVL
jgi:hypothetical protein